MNNHHTDWITWPRLRGFVRSALALVVVTGLGSAQRQALAPVPSALPPEDLAAYGFHGTAASVFAAENAEAGFALLLTVGGLEVTPTEPDQSWFLALQTTLFGRPSALASPTTSTISATGNRASVSYANGLEEWYVNEPRGLEQGWTVADPPAGAGSELRIELALSGDLQGVWDPMLRHCRLVDTAGAVCARYGELHVIDATGSTLPAHFEPLSGGVAIVVDDTAATYPLTIDPILNGPSWAVLGEQPWDDFGSGLALAGDVDGDGFEEVIIGAPGFDGGGMNAGVAQLFAGSSTGLETSPSWSVNGSSVGAQFGFSAGGAGDVNGDGYDDVIVGATGHSAGTNNGGSAHLFLGSAGGLSTSASWVFSGTRTCEFLGSSVAGVGDVNSDGYDDLLVGASGENGTLKLGGAAYLFLGSAAGPAAAPDWSFMGDLANGRFGHVVAAAGDVDKDGFDDFLVGANRYSGNDGRAYLFCGSSAGPVGPTWTFDGTGQERLASSLATAGDVNGDGFDDVILGAPLHDGVGPADGGRVFVFHGSSGGLSSTPARTLVGVPASHFGSGVTGAGDLNRDGFHDVVIGAERHAKLLGSGPQGMLGRVWIYRGSALGVEAVRAAGRGGVNPDSDFGAVVSPAGDTDGDGFDDFLVAAPDDLARGRVFLFTGGRDSQTFFQNTVSSTISSPQLLARLGESLATGDVNDDGIRDVVVGAPDWQDTLMDEGRVAAHYGGANGVTSAADWEVVSGSLTGQLGRDLAVGDLTGDGIDDVLASAPSLSGGSAGGVFLYPGSASGPATVPSWSITGPFGTGEVLAIAGDVDADGDLDVLVGGTAVDEVELYLGALGGPSTTSSWTVSVPALDAIAGVGDANADGFADVMTAGNGIVRGYLGSATGPAATSSATLFDPIGLSFAGSLAAAGDVNGDGFGDVLVGSPDSVLSSPFNAMVGAVHVFHGTASGWQVNHAVEVLGQRNNGRFGKAVHPAGDYDDDGFDDVIVGEPFGLFTLHQASTVHYFRGSPSGLRSLPAWSYSVPQLRAELGFDVSVGDVDGDGILDVVAGSPNHDAGGGNSGSVFVLRGNPLLTGP